MRVTDRVHMLEMSFRLPVGPDRVLERSVRFYLIRGRQLHLVDAGVAGAWGVVESYTRSLGLDPTSLQSVLLTHAHPDHIGGLSKIHAATGCLVVVHSADAAWVEDVAKQSKERPIPGFNDIVEGSVAVSHRLSGGERLELEDGLALRAIHTPGHSPGHVAYLLEGDEVLFAGDCVPVERSPPVYEDAAASMRSLRELRGIPVNLLLSAWDEPRQGVSARDVIRAGMRCLQRDHDAVMQERGGGAQFDLGDLERRVLHRLGLPDMFSGAVTAGAVQSHLRTQANGEWAGAVRGL